MSRCPHTIRNPDLHALLEEDRNTQFAKLPNEIITSFIRRSGRFSEHHTSGFGPYSHCECCVRFEANAAHYTGDRIDGHEGTVNHLTQIDGIVTAATVGVGYRHIEVKPRRPLVPLKGHRLAVDSRLSVNRERCVRILGYCDDGYHFGIEVVAVSATELSNLRVERQIPLWRRRHCQTSQ